jgi:hypothetical protein
MPRPISEVIAIMVERFKREKSAQGAKARFQYVTDSPKEVMVRRQNGNDVPVPLARLGKAIEAARNDSSVYTSGPARLRRHGVAGINSVIYAMLHLVTYDELIM